jgi:hypothetical protein
MTTMPDNQRPIEFLITEAELRNNSEAALFQLIAERLQFAMAEIKARVEQENDDEVAQSIDEMKRRHEAEK